MKKSKLYNLSMVIILIALLIWVYRYMNYIDKDNIVGKYLNINYGSNSVAEIPHVQDTLILYNNNLFKSNYYGKGKYELSYGFDGTQIKLFYKDDYGDGYLSTSITRKFILGNPKINLNKDHGQYYEKQ